MLTPWWKADRGLAYHMLGGVVAFDTENDKTHMTRSGGRRKAGRPARYFVYLDDAYAFTITAADDEDAVQKANAKLQTAADDAQLPQITLLDV